MTEGTRFGEWLERAMAEEGVGNRTLARRIAEQHPQGATEATIESARTTLRRIRSGKLRPGQRTREAIEAALGRTDSPAEDEPITREMILDRIDQWGRDLRRFKRALSTGAIV